MSTESNSDLSNFQQRFADFNKLLEAEKSHNKVKYGSQAKPSSGFKSLFRGRSYEKTYYDKNYDQNEKKITVTGRFDNFIKKHFTSLLTQKNFMRKEMNKLVGEYGKFKQRFIENVIQAADDPKELERLNQGLTEEHDQLASILIAVRDLFGWQDTKKGLSLKKTNLKNELEEQTKVLSSKNKELTSIASTMLRWHAIKQGLLTGNLEAINAGIALLKSKDYTNLPQELQELISKSSPALQFVCEANKALDLMKKDSLALQTDHSKNPDVANTMRSFLEQLQNFTQNAEIPPEIRHTLTTTYQNKFTEALGLYCNCQQSAIKELKGKLEEACRHVSSLGPIGIGENQSGVRELQKCQQELQQLAEAMEKVPFSEIEAGEKATQQHIEELLLQLPDEMEKFRGQVGQEFNQQAKKKASLWLEVSEAKNRLQEQIEAKKSKLQERVLAKQSELAKAQTAHQESTAAIGPVKQSATDDFVSLTQLVTLDDMQKIKGYPLQTGGYKEGDRQVGVTKEQFDRALKAYTILIEAAYNKRDITSAISELNQLNLFTHEVTRSLIEGFSFTYQTQVPEEVQKLTAEKIFELLKRDEVTGVLKRGITALKKDVELEQKARTRLQADGGLDLQKLLLDKKERNNSAPAETNHAGREFISSLSAEEQERVLCYFLEQADLSFISTNPAIRKLIDPAKTPQENAIALIQGGHLETSRVIEWSKLTEKDFAAFEARVLTKNDTLISRLIGPEIALTGRSLQQFRDLQNAIKRQAALTGEISQLQNCLGQVGNSVDKFIESTKGIFLPEEWQEIVAERQKQKCTNWSQAIASLENQYAKSLTDPANKGKSKAITKMLIKLNTLGTDERGAKLWSERLNAKLEAVEYLLEKLSQMPDSSARLASARQRILDRNRQIAMYAPLEKAIDQIGNYVASQENYTTNATVLEAEKVTVGQLEEQRSKLATLEKELTLIEETAGRLRQIEAK